MTILLVLLGLLLPQPQRYDRKAWRHWTSCLDTREIVLITESRTPVRLSSDGCSVLSGDWFDRYLGESVTTPGVLDIDHVVSLGAASRMGGWRWSAERKRAYANDLSFPDHLVAVTASINRAKGDKGPSEWLPPRTDSVCWYVATYKMIADRWELKLPNKDAYLVEVTQAGCRSKEVQFSVASRDK